MREDPWYKELAFYQIWPRSFMDGNGDGIGDLYGVYDKLDYIKSLNVDGIWFSPLYVSPNADYGYDISDYMQISPDYGDLEIFKKVLDGAHRRGLRVLMDLVINHTSDEHPWFRAGIADPDGPYRDYYFWRKGRAGGKLPNNWDSGFGGKAWEYNETLDAYYLHLFTRKQPDLNLDNPAVREEIKSILRFWLDLGVDGFREDAITFASKAPGLPNDTFAIAGRGLKYYNHGPNIHAYLQEFKRDVLAHYDCVTVGEAPLISPEKALEYIAEDGPQELDMVFHFDHMGADCLFTEYHPLPFSLRRLKRAFTRWQTGLRGRGWNALYLENHDHPRIISRYGSEEHRVESGKMLAACYLFQQGTPFLYQGQEIGMTNLSLETIDEYRDIVAKNEYKKRGRWSEDRRMALIRRATRDSARSPMQWSAAPNAGFTTGEPWFALNPNYTEVNVAHAEDDPNSLLNFYRHALQFRRENPVVLWGDYREYNPRDRWFYTYSRTHEGVRLLVICHFGKTARRYTAPAEFSLEDRGPVFSNYPDSPTHRNGFTARPYETRVYLFPSPDSARPSTQ